MRVYVLGTGSSGNALIVEADGVRLLLEAGLGPRVATVRMRSLGADLFPRGVDGIVVTHQHNDHAAQLLPLCKALGAPGVAASEPMLHLHDGIDAPLVRHRFGARRYRAGESFEVRGLRVRTLALAHDAPHVAVSVESKTHCLGFVTDVGSVTSKLVDFLAPCDTVLLESNYCPTLLDTSPYPVSLRRRIAGDLGHLSNAQAAWLVSRLVRSRAQRIALCHLSQRNNEPELALRAVRDESPDAAVEVLRHGEAKVLDLAPRLAASRFEQLPLFASSSK